MSAFLSPAGADVIDVIEYRNIFKAIIDKIFFTSWFDVFFYTFKLTLLFILCNLFCCSFKKLTVSYKFGIAVMGGHLIGHYLYITCNIDNWMLSRCPPCLSQDISWWIYKLPVKCLDTLEIIPFDLKWLELCFELVFFRQISILCTVRHIAFIH